LSRRSAKRGAVDKPARARARRRGPRSARRNLLAGKDRNPPFATVCCGFGERPLRAETAPGGKARLPAHMRRSRSRSATAVLRRDATFNPSRRMSAQLRR
jgi:hypothetical protein